MKWESTPVTRYDDGRDPAFFGAPLECNLPCGNIGYLDGCGYRCEECFAIYGSISCPCSKIYEKKDEVKS